MRGEEKLAVICVTGAWEGRGEKKDKEGDE